MVSPVIAIGLDSADPALMESWLEGGELPNIKALYERGVYKRLSNYDWYRAETPWTTFLTGTSPEKTGYWSPIKYYPERYCVDKVNAFDFEEYAPFYAKMKGKKVVVFDMPQTSLSEAVDGIQVLAWGTHSGQTESVSKPENVWQDIVNKYGVHPLLNDDGANCYSLEQLEVLYEKMVLGIKRRAQISADLIREENPDFFMTIFGEAHVAGHYFWHLGQEHPLYDEYQRRKAKNLLLLAFKEIDAAIGTIVEACGDDSNIIVFSAHGMGPNNMDLPSVAFLPEFLYRWNFPGKKAIAPGNFGDDLAPIETAVAEKYKMADVLWAKTRESDLIRRVLKAIVPIGFYRKFERRLPAVNMSEKRVFDPFLLRKNGEAEPFQCSNWFNRFWPEMKAFALPSFSEGYVRINVKGRDSQGVVHPEDYQKVCDEICQDLQKLVDARTGKLMVDKIVRTRKSLDEETVKSPDADLVVVWQEDTVADVVESEKVGRIGPIPFWRTGSHRAGGFVIVTGPEFEDVSMRDDGHAIDFAPTFLKAVGCDPDPQHEGDAFY